VVDFPIRNSGPYAQYSASGMRQPGAATLGPADTDSRDNGTPDAGRRNSSP